MAKAAVHTADMRGMQLRRNSATMPIRNVTGGQPVSLDLPEPRTDHLERSPLSLVVCQVRHERNDTVSEAPRAVAVHEQIADLYPQLEDQASQELMIMAGESGVQAGPSQASRGWRMRDSGGSWTVTLMPDFFSVETTSYETWSDFSGRTKQVLNTVVDELHPAVEERIGLRFIDRITHPSVTVPADWRGLIQPAFLGPIESGIGEAVAATQNVVQLGLDDGRNVILRHGAARETTPNGEAIYIVDTDCFVQRGRALSLDRALASIESLHSLALQLFQAAITDSLYEYLQGAD